MSGTTDTPSIFVRVNSHRARQRIDRLGVELRWHYTWEAGGRFLLLTPSEFEKVKDVPSVTRCRDQKPESYSKCWNGEKTK